MANPQLRILAAFGLAAACGVAGAGVWMLAHPQEIAHAQDSLEPNSSPPGDSHSADPASRQPEEADASSGELKLSLAAPHDQHAAVATDAGSHTSRTGTAPAEPVPADAQPASSRTLRDPRRVQGDLIRADDALRRGNLADAMKLYSAAIGPEGPDADPVVYFRWALCAESLGLLDESAQRYKQLAARAASPAWRGFARWGLARVLRRQGRTDMAIRVTSEVWLTQDESAPLWRDDLAHWFGHLLYRRVVDDRTADLLDESTLARCELIVPLRRLMAIASRIHSSEVGQGDPTPTFEDEGIDSRFEAPVRQGDLSLTLEQATAASAIDAVAQRRDWILAWTPRAAELARSRACRVHATCDAPTVLDAVCEASGLTWSLEDRRLSLRDMAETTRDEQQGHRIGVAARSLAYAIGAMPDNRWTDYSRIGLAQLADLRGEHAVAQRTLEELVVSSRHSPVMAEAWYDLGKLHSREGRIDEAIAAFQRCADTSGSSALEPIGNLYLGKLLLEAERPREAVLVLRRAAALAGPPERPRAVLTLVAGYLADGRPQSANEVLRAYKDDLEIESARDAAAFLSALSQVRGASDSFRRSYDQKSLMAAISHVAPDDYFTWEGAALIVDAYRELGFADEAARVASYAVDRMPSCRLRQRLRLVLAEDALIRNDIAAAKEILPDIASLAAGDVRRRAHEMLCDLLLNEGNVAEAKGTASAWLERSESPQEQAAALRALGRCLEREGDRLNAALCFAGTRPSLGTAPTTKTE